MNSTGKLGAQIGEFQLMAAGYKSGDKCEHSGIYRGEPATTTSQAVRLR